MARRPADLLQSLCAVPTRGELRSDTRRAFPVPPIDISRVDPRYLRQEVFYQSREQPGTIIVNPDARFLYLVLGNSRALRYGVGVGRQGFGWNGRATIQRKAAWPTWTPTENMIRRDPKLARYAGGMPPGLNNPLGARALYLFQNGQDTLYRLHGTNEPGVSARRFRADVYACSIRTLSTCTTARPSARRLSCCRTAGAPPRPDVTLAPPPGLPPVGGVHLYDLFACPPPGPHVSPIAIRAPFAGLRPAGRSAAR
jgi:hypothetical protein